MMRDSAIAAVAGRASEQLPSQRMSVQQTEPSPGERRERLKEVLAQARGCAPLPRAGGDAQNGRLRRRQRGRGADVHRRGPGRERGRAGRAVRRPGGEAARAAARGDRADRAEVFIANTLKCRPPGNRDPLPVEIENCQDYLLRQVELIQPTVICTLGNFSTKLLRGDPTGITRLHGQPEVLVLGRRAVRLYPDLPSGGGAVHAAHARDAARGLRAAARAARAGRARAAAAAGGARAGAGAARRRPRAAASRWPRRVIEVDQLGLF